MLDYIYPEEEQRVFTNREHELALLDLSRNLLAQGIRKHLAFIGFRRVGKTLILKEFLRRHQEGQRDDQVVVAYLDLARLSLTPEAFAVQYIGNILYWLTSRREESLESYFDPSFQAMIIARYGNDALSRHTLAIHQELQKEKPNQHLLLEMAFNWIEVWAMQTGHRAVLILDEFPEVLALSNYPQVRDVMALFRAVLQAQSRVCYVVAGSMISLMERIFLAADSPLFVHFQLASVGRLAREETDALVQKRLSPLHARVPSDVTAAFYQLTRGHPFYVYATAMRVLEMVSLFQEPLAPRTVQRAFTLETLGTTGRIYNLCRYVLEESLQRARGETMLQAALHVLAREATGTSLTSLARRLKRPTGAIRQVLNWLREVDLVEQLPDKSYAFRDPVLQMWVAYYAAGLDLTGMPHRAVLDQLATELMERYQRVAGELGVAKESHVREMLRHFDGQEVDGELLGLAGKVRLPTFRQVHPYRSRDGQIEADALAEGDERWIVEVKWRGRTTGLKEVQRLETKAGVLSARPWFISRSGFTPEAEAYARRAGIMYSKGDDLAALGEAVAAPS